MAKKLYKKVRTSDVLTRKNNIKILLGNRIDDIGHQKLIYKLKVRILFEDAEEFIEDFIDETKSTEIAFSFENTNSLDLISRLYMRWTKKAMFYSEYKEYKQEQRNILQSIIEVEIKRISQ